jgi:hypothetical protein
MRNVVPLITQTEEYDEDVHLPQFSKRAEAYGFEAGEAQDEADETFNRFSRDVLGNSSAVVSDESDGPHGEDAIVLTGNMGIVQEGVKTYDQYISQNFGPTTRDEVHMTAISPEIVDSPAIAPHACSTSFSQARSEAKRYVKERWRNSLAG